MRSQVGNLTRKWQGKCWSCPITRGFSLSVGVGRKPWTGSSQGAPTYHLEGSGWLLVLLSRWPQPAAAAGEVGLLATAEAAVIAAGGHSAGTWVRRFSGTRWTSPCGCPGFNLRRNRGVGVAPGARIVSSVGSAALRGSGNVFQSPHGTRLTSVRTEGSARAWHTDCVLCWIHRPSQFWKGVSLSQRYLIGRLGRVSAA